MNTIPLIRAAIIKLNYAQIAAITRNDPDYCLEANKHIVTLIKKIKTIERREFKKWMK